MRQARHCSVWGRFALVISLWIATLVTGAGAQQNVPGGQTTPDNQGRRKTITPEALEHNFSNPDMLYAPFIFWFWDESPNSAKAETMARVIAGQRFNPGYAHARHEMVRAPGLPKAEWLSGKWFDAFGAALAEAEKARAYLGYCDEYWWPSFQAAGRVLAAHPELRPASLKWDALDARGGATVSVPASFFAVAAQLAQPIPATEKNAEDRVPLGSWIWHPRTRDNQQCLFVKSFEIPAGETVATARIQISVDNAYQLLLDGMDVGSGNSWYDLNACDVTARLKPGRHEIRVRATNVDQSAGLMFGMRIRLAGGRAIDIVSDASWQAGELIQGGPANGSPRVAARVIAPLGGGPWKGQLRGAGTGGYSPRTIRSASLKVIGAGEPFAWTAPEGADWCVYVFKQYSHPGVDGGAVNCLDERLAPAFIKIALEPYAQRFAGQMGKSIPGDFIDHEGDYGWRLAWSDSLGQRYRERYGRDIRLWMPLMIDADTEGLCARARWEWFDLVSDLYTGQFKQVTAWHEQRGMSTTAHVWEESLLAQAYAVGDHMKFLRSVTMPGQDCLGRKSLRIHDFKENTSVAEFEGTRAMTELMGAGGFEGTKWGTFTPPFLKQSINAVTAWGISHIIPHGVFTVRKLDGNPWPPDWYSESPMFPYMHLWTDFARRAAWVNAHGHAAADVLLYNPLESVWALTDGALFDEARPADGLAGNYSEANANGRRANRIDRIYSKAIQDLTDARVEFLVTDRHYLGQMNVNNGTLVRGELVFKTVVLPEMIVMPRALMQKIVEFARGGGRVYALGTLPAGSTEAGMNDPEMARLLAELQSLPTFKQCPPEPENVSDPHGYGLTPLIGQNAPGLGSHVHFATGQGFPMLQRHVRIGEADFFWLVNNTGEWQSAELHIQLSPAAASVWDCETGQVRPVAANVVSQGAGELAVKTVFRPYEAYWLVFDPAKPVDPKAPEMKRPEYETVQAIAGTWKVTCDPKNQPEMEHPLSPPAELVAGTEKPLEDWKAWGLEKFSGLMDYVKTIEVEQVEGKMVLDLGKVGHVAEVWVNGQSAGARMWGPHVFDVSGKLKPGRNEIRVRVANLINNSYGEPLESGLLGPVKVERERQVK